MGKKKTKKGKTPFSPSCKDLGGSYLVFDSGLRQTSLYGTEISEI